MKKTVILVLLTLCLGLISCKNQNNKDADTIKTTDVVSPKDTYPDKKSNKVSEDVFDINSIPISDATLELFPFFDLPKNLEYQNAPLKKDYDEIFFPLTKTGDLDKIGGKLFKSYITQEDDTGNWSLPYFIKSYDDAITSIGGVLVFKGKLTDSQLQYLNDNAQYLGEEGSIDYWNEPVNTYVIRRPNGDHIYIQLYANTASGAIQIIQKEAFKQTVSLLKATQIQKDLNEKGKAVLYINFDTNKATLTPDGKNAVAEITKVLNTDNLLKININGYTDNTGDDARNTQLSKDRAETVMKAIIATGIDSSRLHAYGFGANNPIADNSTVKGKAKNRRVELTKE